MNIYDKGIYEFDFYSSLDYTKYAIYIDLKGSSSNEYFNNSKVLWIEILNENDIRNNPLPPPQLQKAQFTSNGTYIEIYFDTLTNQGGINYKSLSTFSCNKLLSFNDIIKTKCKWLKDDLLRIEYISLTNLNIGSMISINNLPDLKLQRCCLLTSSSSSSSLISSSTTHDDNLCHDWPFTNAGNSNPIFILLESTS